MIFFRYAIASRKPYSYILQFAVCLGQLYGCLLYFITAFLEGDNFATSPYYYWAYYVGANSSWVVIPLLIAIRSWKKITAALQAEKKMKTRWTWTHRHSRESRNLLINGDLTWRFLRKTFLDLTSCLKLFSGRNQFCHELAKCWTTCLI